MIYTKGFYNKDEDYDFLSTLIINNKQFNALKYLHGNCHEFSIALYKEFGYPIVLWTEYDEHIDEMILIHAFNIIQQDNNIYYADIRGITNDLNTLTSGFDYFDDISINIRNIDNTLDILHRLRIEIQDLNTPKTIIQKYKEYYIL